MTGKSSQFKVELGRNPDSVESVVVRRHVIYDAYRVVEAAAQNYPLPATMTSTRPNTVVHNAAEQVIERTFNSNNTEEITINPSDTVNSTNTQPDINYAAPMSSTQPEIDHSALANTIHPELDQARANVDEALKNG